VPRTLKDDPRWRESKTEVVTPNFTSPKIDQVLPIRIAARTLSALPHALKSKAERLLPSFTKDLTESVLPRRRLSNMDNVASFPHRT
jgi:hypothetical protein